MQPADPPQKPRYQLPPAGAPLPAVVSSADAEAIPSDLHNYLRELEAWANANKQDARRDAFFFWLLKVPAIFASASAGLCAYFNLTAVSVITGTLASICVLADGILPLGMLRNTHLRAVHDLRILTSRILADWRSRHGNTKDENAAKKIIRDSVPEKERIANYIRDAETALKFKSKV